MNIGVTGASGYVGGALLRRLRANGHRVVAIGRRAVAAADENRVADLREPVPPGLLAGLDAVVHAAADTGAGAVDGPRELAFARELVAEATRAGCRVLFLSSQAAADDAPSAYGRTKAAIEAVVRATGGQVVRPGLVYGGRGRAGLFGLLEALVARSRVLPALAWPAPRVHPVHVDDLALACVRLLELPADTMPVAALGGPPIAFGDFLAAIARHRLARRVVLVPTPVVAVRAALALASRRLGPRLSPARLDSLLRLPALGDGGDLARLGVVARDLRDGLCEARHARRALVREGARLARALLGRRAPPSLVRRYARALPRLGVTRPLGLRCWLGPALLASLDTRARRTTAMPGGLAWRFGVVARLAEAEPRLADCFLAREERSGALRAIALVAAAAALEVRGRILAPVAWLGRPRA